MDNSELQWVEALSEREMAVLRLIADGLSNQEIADSLVLSVNTVRWYNKQVYSKLDVNSRTLAVAKAQQLGLFYDESSASYNEVGAQVYLPVQLSSFIGRQRELTEIGQLLANHRLLTLTGPGGTGKTRLAIKVAEGLAGVFGEGIYFVDLAPLAAASMVASAVATALSVHENPNEPVLDTLKRALGERELLLVIDNFEHVIEAAEIVSELLLAAHHIKVLATSREPLRLSGEQEYPVPPLSLAENDALIHPSEAVTLFAQRAKMVRPSFELSASNASAVMEICLRLDGLPLALELAAARSKLLTPQAILDRLNNRLSALTGGSRDLPKRQQTLRQTIAWSYNLLDEDEKRLFARLAVFRGGRSLEAIENVCCEGLSTDVFDALSSLLDKSMIRQVEDNNGEPRFVMLETIQEYALEQLQASGEADTLRQRHAAYFTELAEKASPELRLAQQKYWFQVIGNEQDNFRAVLEWSLIHNQDALAIQLIGAIYLYWYAYGLHVEGYHWMQHFMEELESATPAHQARFLIGSSHIAGLRDLDEAVSQLERAVSIARQIGEPRLTGWALMFLGYSSQHKLTVDAISIAEEGLALLRQSDDAPGIAQALNIIGEVARVRGEDDRAKVAYEECLTLSRQTGETRRISFMLENLAMLAQHKGDDTQALELLSQSLVMCRDLGNKLDLATNLSILAGSLNALGDPEKAARLLGASEAALEMMGAFHQASDQQEVDQIVVAVSSQMGETAFDEARSEGRRLSLETAVAYALDEVEFEP